MFEDDGLLCEVGLPLMVDSQKKGTSHKQGQGQLSDGWSTHIFPKHRLNHHSLTCRDGSPCSRSTGAPNVAVQRVLLELAIVEIWNKNMHRLANSPGSTRSSRSGGRFFLHPLPHPYLVWHSASNRWQKHHEMATAVS